MTTSFVIAGIAALLQPQGLERPAYGSVAHHFRPEDYPPAAARRGAQGEVGVRLHIAPDGRVSGCSVSSSSGHQDLDRRTCEVLRQRAKVEPAHDRSGRPVAGALSSTVHWRLAERDPEVELARFERFRQVTTIIFSGDGLLSCSLETNEQPAVDIPAEVCRAVLPEGALEGGIPAGARGEMAIVLSLTPNGTEPLAAPAVSFGTPAGEAEAEIALAADGSISGCRITMLAGRAQEESDYCDMLRQGGAPSFEPAPDSRPRVGRLRVTAYGRLLTTT